MLCTCMAIFSGMESSLQGVSGAGCQNRQSTWKKASPGRVHCTHTLRYEAREGQMGVKEHYPSSHCADCVSSAVHLCTQELAV
ncbi:hypothetical protein FKM82_027108 [Ascaphus truei]